MVCDWSPEPPRDFEDHMSMPSENVNVETDDSEDETFGNAPPGYELLPQGPMLGPSSDEEEQNDTEVGTSSTQIVSDVPSENAPSSDTGDLQRTEVQEVDRLFSEPALRPELIVDCDQVRAAMSGFTLPTSAIPAWAVNVPESQWASTLSQHIQRIQSSGQSDMN